MTSTARVSDQYPQIRDSEDDDLTNNLPNNPSNHKIRSNIPNLLSRVRHRCHCSTRTLHRQRRYVARDEDICIPCGS